MIPLGDDNPLHPGQRQYITWLFIAVCIGAFVYQLSLPPETGQMFAFMYGVIPAYFMGVEPQLPQEVLQQIQYTIPAPAVSPYVSLITSMFLHGGLMHLAGNMMYLWIFGDNVELAMGHKRFIVFYLLCGIVAAVAQIATDPSSGIPMVGASGAISGVLGAYIMLFPRANVRVYFTLGPFFMWRMMYVPAFIVLGLWFGGQILSGMASVGKTGGGVAFWAHIGGFVAGLVLVKFFIRRDEKLFHAPEHSPWEMAKRGQLPPRRVAPPPTIPTKRGPWNRG